MATDADLLIGGLRDASGRDCRQIPPALAAVYEASAADVAEYDAKIIDHAGPILDQLQGIEVVVGIPYYTELSNVLSVCISLREGLINRKTKALILILGEFTRSDMVEKLKEATADVWDEHDRARGQGLVHVEAFWKPDSKYQQKPWSVRAFMNLAAMANGGEGAHLVIVDADIQFNYWELSARSLLDALLGPLESEHNPASLVCLNAPRSFYADDAIVHLWCFLFFYAVYGVKIHQLHGGEFSLHRRLNQAILSDKTLQHVHAYCLQGQLMARAALAPQYGHIVERKMRGKWHAKITLGKLVDIPANGAPSRIDMVTERMFQDALLLGPAALARSENGVVAEVDYTSSTSTPSDFNPDEQRMSVLAPGPARKELLRALCALYAAFKRDHMVGDACPGLLESSTTVTCVLPLAARVHDAVVAGQRVEVSALQLPGDEALPYTPETWATSTFELLRAYREANGDRGRALAVHGNRLAWLLGAIAFMKDTWSMDWRSMHTQMWDSYSHAFRHAYLQVCGGTAEGEAS